MLDKSLKLTIYSKHSISSNGISYNKAKLYNVLYVVLGKQTPIAVLVSMSLISLCCIPTDRLHFIFHVYLFTYVSHAISRIKCSQLDIIQK